MKEEDIKRIVRNRYGSIARQNSSCCAPSSSCCGSPAPRGDLATKVGYTRTDLDSVPQGSNLGLGCGNPVALASLRKGEIVLDLGSGAGFDCFLAARKVGDAGKVIGVDMTSEMVEKARAHARSGDVRNVEFRLGEIENLPVSDNSIDAVISNCVVNLSPDKPRVFSEAYRVLKPGGRLMVSDIVLLKELPAAIRNSLEAYVGCIAGAMLKDDYVYAIESAGFREVRIVEETSFPVEQMVNDPIGQTLLAKLSVLPRIVNDVANAIVSIKIEGRK